MPGAVTTQEYGERARCRRSDIRNACTGIHDALELFAGIRADTNIAVTQYPCFRAHVDQHDEGVSIRRKGAQSQTAFRTRCRCDTFCNQLSNTRQRKDTSEATEVFKAPTSRQQIAFQIGPG
ncbi:Uncharacterised protein [Klebsiella pneumoniae]|nr:Uncharacterised protein [Klebsiella pneumoniae]